ncbi:class I SAM-dependent methyltransferase [Nodularia spumigena]|uniref:class I SAM-dependent methyltransferase n=1 Tax=Nodularia spumigena TaxID=70799 RepID=UPI00232F4B48|nr:class I SAM-dependent methyltransferase [Nodularia spumigena]MDB9347412.1 class I SAM-dependent methyltransferase [Nodularia spumigena CS-588/01]MDB9354458.1 class I SAM-dependent methyltransferase [Nodularia spumigena CS-588/05]
MIGKTLIHTFKYFLGLENPSTQVSNDEQNMLSSLAKNAKKVLEIGVFEGHSTKSLATSMSSGVLYAVDPFFTGSLGISYGLLITQQQIRQARRINHNVSINLVRDFSYNLAKDKSITDFDLIFIDGDHSLEGIKQDYADWSDRVKKGGYLALHDTKVPSHNPNVAKLGSFQYFESYIKFDSRFQLVDQIDSLSILKRL